MATECDTIREQFELYLLDDLPPAGADAVRSHLRGCPGCQSAMAGAAAMLETVDRALREPAAPPELADRVLAAMDRRARRRRLRWVPVAAAACLAAAVIVSVWAPWATRPTKPALTVDDLVGCRIETASAAKGGIGGPEGPGGAAARGGSGPRFEVLGPRRIRLEEGELALSVEPTGERFVVETPAGAATVLGTRFRVNTHPLGGGQAMRTAKFVTMVMVLSGLVQFSNEYGMAVAADGETVVATEDSAPVKHAAKLADRFGNHYKPVPVDVKPAVPAYTLPVDLDAADSLADIVTKLRLADKALLAKHGFAVYPRLGDENDDFAKFYGDLKKMELPVYVTSDSVLHLYHLQFDKILKTAEETEFIPALEALLGSLDGHLAAGAAKDRLPSAAEQSARGLARSYLHVALRLLTDRSDDRPLLEALRKDVEAAGRRSWGISGKHREAMKCFTDSNAAYAAVNSVPTRGKEAALKLIDAELGAIDATKPKDNLLPVAQEVAIAEELKLMAAHEGWAESPLFVWQEDYSQYVPRGHYTQSPALKRYFKAMMYLGRMTFLVKGGEPWGPGKAYLVSEEESRRQTLAAALLTDALDKAKLDDGVKALDVWRRIYDVTAFMVGQADDLGYEEYKPALDATLGARWRPQQLGGKAAFFKLKKELARLSPPAIYSGTGNVISFDPAALAGMANEAELDRVLVSTMGFRLMGQRFVPDSYWMGKLVFPTVGAPTARHDPAPFTLAMTAAGPRRCFPRGLDVAALLGSNRAAAILNERGDTAYDGYDKAMAKLKGEVAQLSDADWNFNLYWSWLHCLKPMLVEFGAGYPTYMQQAAWQDKELAAALGSWSELRHDTILYVKQSYTMRAGAAPRIPAPRPGYVEPVPEVYARLLALARLTKDRMAAMKCLDEEMTRRLDATETLLARLLEISKRELENQVLKEEDYEYIRKFGGAMRTACVGGGFRDEARDELKTTLVADVHTDGNTLEVLEEATGQLAVIVVVNKLPDGKLYASCGPVFTYYEFKQPMKDRLTDGTWIEMLAEGKGRYDLLPDWYRAGLGAGWGN